MIEIETKGVTVKGQKCRMITKCRAKMFNVLPARYTDPGHGPVVYSTKGYPIRTEFLGHAYTIDSIAGSATIVLILRVGHKIGTIPPGYAHGDIVRYIICPGNIYKEDDFLEIVIWLSRCGERLHKVIERTKNREAAELAEWNKMEETIQI